MAQVGAPAGNKNATKGRVFWDGLIREIKQRDFKAGDGETIRKVAAMLVDGALLGDLQCIKELRDTLDGKPHQSISGADGGPIVIIQASRLDETI